jgi:hypothetical protein
MTAPLISRLKENCPDFVEILYGDFHYSELHYYRLLSKINELQQTSFVVNIVFKHPVALL